MIYLAGDSVFDNAAYTSPSLIEQMGTGARLLARDGVVVATIMGQLRRDPSYDDRIVISVGGNDALGSMDLVTSGRRAGVDVLGELAARVGAFQLAYGLMLEEVWRAGWRRVLCCTIYNGNFKHGRAPIAAGVRLFDDAIQRCARGAGFDVLELRDIFTEPEDFANSIEPSHVGGKKLAAAILAWAGSRP